MAAGVGLMVAMSACDRSRTPEPTPGERTAPAAPPPVAASSAPAAISPSPSPSPSAATGAPAAAAFKGKLPAAERIVAIGDLHGDLEATRRAFKLAGAIDDKDAWRGGKLVVVQTGDEIDRGDDDRTILDWVERLKGEAAKAGGAVVAMVGNHEIMNANFDFRYVTPGAFRAFDDVTPKNPGVAVALANLDARARGRAAAFAPGGAYAAMLARRPVIAQVGDTVFVHGGVLPKHVAYGIDRINDEARAWLLGEKSESPAPLQAEDGPLWTRMYSAATGREECAVLDKTLQAMGAKRMVVGHTVQRAGASAACDGNVWRIDVGMSKFFGGSAQTLEIKGDDVAILK